MKEAIPSVYRPGRLAVGISGMPGPDPDTKRINENLIRQNICLLCYREEKTIDELAALTGIPKPYLEFDLDWLVQREFLSPNGKRYRTAFAIIDQKHYQHIGALYQDSRREYIDKIIDHLYASYETIRGIGFYGSDFPRERLMWAVIMLFTSYVSRNSELLLRLKKRDERSGPTGAGTISWPAMSPIARTSTPKGYFKPEGWGGIVVSAPIAAPRWGIRQVLLAGRVQFLRTLPSADDHRREQSPYAAASPQAILPRRRTRVFCGNASQQRERAIGAIGARASSKRTGKHTAPALSFCPRSNLLPYKGKCLLRC